MALDLFVRLVSAARSLTFRRRQKNSHALSNVRLKRRSKFKRRRNSSLTSAPYSLDPAEFTIYADQEWMVDTSPISPRVQVESRNGSSTSSFPEYRVNNSVTYSTSSHPKTGPSPLPPPALPVLPLVLNGPKGPSDIKEPHGTEPEFTKAARHASRWRRKIRSAISQNQFPRVD